MLDKVASPRHTPGGAWLTVNCRLPAPGGAWDPEKTPPVAAHLPFFAEMPNVGAGERSYAFLENTGFLRKFQVTSSETSGLGVVART